MKPTRFGLKIRSILILSVTSLVLAIVITVLLGRQVAVRFEVRSLSAEILQRIFQHSLRSRAEDLTRDLAQRLAWPLQHTDYARISATVDSVAQAHLARHILVYDIFGRVIYSSTGDEDKVVATLQDPLFAAAAIANNIVTQTRADGIDIYAPIRSRSLRVGGVRVEMADSQVEELERQANQSLAASLNHFEPGTYAWIAVIVILLILVALLLTMYVQRTLVTPVRALAAAAQQIERGNYATQLAHTSRKDEIGELIRAFIRMSQSIERHDREVLRLAYTDMLTGLANRLSFRERMDRSMANASAQGAQLALLFADIDDFKRVNDTLGHEAGDDALLQFAGRIDRAVQSLECEHAELARFGGDEFAILIQAKDVSVIAAQLAELLVLDLRQPLRVQDGEVFLGTSIGITQFPDDATDVSSLLKNADIAMYQAKFSGKNCYRFYNRAMDHAVKRRAQMEHELRSAWERGELHLEYQPIYRMVDQTMVGVEVLLRWLHPTLGTIPPSTFIEVAEQSGMIEKIGPKVLRKACLDAATWPLTNPPLFISVNVSSRQLRDGNLVALVAKNLAESGLPAARLHLELTETAVIGDQQQAAQLLDSLHRTGVKVWLDDFCTGFSGLSHLRQVPVDGVKIDKSFVTDLQRDPDDLALTTALIAMAHSLGITVVAEGIEQEIQYDLLRERNCDLGQGYWFSRPLRAADMFAFLSGN